MDSSVSLQLGVCWDFGPLTPNNYISGPHKAGAFGQNTRRVFAPKGANMSFPPFWSKIVVLSFLQIDRPNCPFDVLIKAIHES